MTQTFIHPSQRFRLYFDETGNGDLHAFKKDPNQKYLSLTGIVVRQDTHDTDLTSQLNNIKTAIFGTENIVFHRRELMAKKAPFEALKDDKVREDFDNRCLAIVNGLAGPVFTVSIDKEAHFNKYKVWQFAPYHYAMVCMLERFVLWLNRTNNVGDIMGEIRGPTHDAQLRQAARHFYKHGTTVKTEVIQRCLVTKELKLESKAANIAGLQVADILAHPAHRSFKMEKLQQQIPNDYGASLVRILEKSKYDRNRWTGKVEGYGKKWLP